MARLFFIISVDAMEFVCSCRFHFYAHDMTRQVEARHFCGHQNEEMRQCLIYNSALNRMLGLLGWSTSSPNICSWQCQTWKLWHTYEYEVKSGVLFMPGVPGPIYRGRILRKSARLTVRHFISGRLTGAIICL
jgi:hypothetical protein